MSRADKADVGAREPGYQDLVQTFTQSELELPPIPEELLPRLRCLESWAWATRSIDADAMYDFREYIAEPFRKPVEDYVAVSHAGHGINSYGLNYHLVYGPLAVFTQVGWGGVYMDSTKNARVIADTFRRSRALVELLGDSARGGVVRSPVRVVVAWSEFRGNCAHTVVARSRAVGSSEVTWEHRGPFSGMGWLPVNCADGSPVAWSHHDDPEALFRSATAALVDALRLPIGDSHG